MNEAYWREVFEAVSNWLKVTFPDAQDIVRESRKSEDSHFVVVDAESSYINIEICMIEDKDEIDTILSSITERLPSTFQRWICLVGTLEEAQKTAIAVRSRKFGANVTMVVGRIGWQDLRWTFIELLRELPEQADEE